MKLQLPNKLETKFAKISVKAKKHSPELFLVTGVVGVVASTVMACRATLKVYEVLEEHNETMDKINNYVEENGYSEKYTEQDHSKDTTIVYTQTVVKFVKLYAPAVLLGAASIGSIVYSHKLLSGRNAALAAAFAASSTGFKEYRQRVVERFGEEVDKELRFNVREEEIEKTVVDEKGKEKTVKETVKVSDAQPSIYSRCFDEGCSNWTKDAECNRITLQNLQNYANDRLRLKGFLFLNEVYQMIGFEETKAGQIVGWVYDKKNPEMQDVVDFGIFTMNNARFVNGDERSVWLDFNVRGNILDLI